MQVPEVKMRTDSIMDQGSDERRYIESEIVIPFEISRLSEVAICINDCICAQEIITDCSSDEITRDIIIKKHKKDSIDKLARSIIFELYLRLCFILMMEHYVRCQLELFSPWSFDSFTIMCWRFLYDQRYDEVGEAKVNRFLSLVDGVSSLFRDRTTSDILNMCRKISIRIGSTHLYISNDHVINKILALSEFTSNFIYRMKVYHAKPAYSNCFILGTAISDEEITKVTPIEELISNLPYSQVTTGAFKSSRYAGEKTIMRLKPALMMIIRNKYYNHDGNYPGIIFEAAEKLTPVIGECVRKILGINVESPEVDCMGNRDLLKLYTISVAEYVTSKTEFPEFRFRGMEDAIETVLGNKYNLLRSWYEVFLNVGVIKEFFKGCDDGTYTFHAAIEKIKVCFALISVADNNFGIMSIPVWTYIICSLLGIENSVNDYPALLSHVERRIEPIIEKSINEYEKASTELFRFLYDREYYIPGIGCRDIESFAEHEHRRMMEIGAIEEMDFIRFFRNEVFYTRLLLNLKNHGGISEFKSHIEKCSTDSVNRFLDYFSEFTEVMRVNGYMDMSQSFNQMISNFINIFSPIEEDSNFGEMI